MKSVNPTVPTPTLRTLTGVSEAQIIAKPFVTSDLADKARHALASSTSGKRGQ